MPAVNHTAGQLSADAGLQLGGITNVVVKSLKSVAIAIDPASIPAVGAAGSAVKVSVALPAGTASAAAVVLGILPPANLEAGLYVASAYFSAADTLILTLGNSTAGAVDGASKTWTFLIADF